MFVLHYLGILQWPDLLKDLINTPLLRLKIQILDIDHLTQLPSLFHLLLHLLNLLDNVSLINHPQRRVLQINKVVLELVILEVLHYVLGEFWVLKLSDGYGSVGCDEESLDHAVELEELF